MGGKRLELSQETDVPFYRPAGLDGRQPDFHAPMTAATLHSRARSAARARAVRIGVRARFDRRWFDSASEGATEKIPNIP